MNSTFVYILVASILLFSCSQGQKSDHLEHAKTEEGKDTYTCPMHPNVIQDSPGKCPVCGMDLVAVNKNASGNSNDLMLSDSQIRLANITTQKIMMQPVGQTAIVNATLAENEELTEIVSSRAEGRIEKLFVKETGRTVQKGEPLYQLYSETLLTLQREYLLAKEQFEKLGETEKRYESFFKAAERKLLLYGLTSNQVAKLSDANDLQPRVTFLSPATGIVTKVDASEGQSVQEGSSLFKIENISKLWLEAELYPNETALVKIGDKIKVRVSGFENQATEAIVSFLSPEFRAGTQIMVMRASVNNTELKFKPGMQAQVLFTHSAKEALTLPVDAVIRNAKGAHVYVQTGANTFSPRMVHTGVEDFEMVEITRGLAAGDTVVVSGAYLLYSEIILKKGIDPMTELNKKNNL
jgi:membrane fusion protein, copper/silver efflux system